jgi:hypothetical protein
MAERTLRQLNRIWRPHRDDQACHDGTDVIAVRDAQDRVVVRRRSLLLPFLDEVKAGTSPPLCKLGPAT